MGQTHGPRGKLGTPFFFFLIHFLKHSFEIHFLFTTLYLTSTRCKYLPKKKKQNSFLYVLFISPKKLEAKKSAPKYSNVIKRVEHVSQSFMQHEI